MDTVQEALNLLSMHFGNYSKDSNIGKILQVLFSNDETFYQAAEDMKKVLDLDDASGKNLDLIHGKNKNLKRGSLSDADYRERLKLETKVNNSDGDIETLEEAAGVLFGDDFKGITEIDNAKISTLLNLNGQSLSNETYERAITASVDNEYNLRDETQTINVVVQPSIMQKFVYLEIGTVTTSNEMGVLL